MKIVKKADLERRHLTQTFFDSIAIQKELDHPHIAKIYELYQDHQYYYIIYEYYH